MLGTVRRVASVAIVSHEGSVGHTHAGTESWQLWPHQKTGGHAARAMSVTTSR